MRPILHQITPDYRAFVDDQVLTSGQLNEFLDYFEDQQRLTRICLNGVGIVCGFEVSLNAATKTIAITPGCGITTDGDLIKLLVDAKKTPTDDESTQNLTYKTLAKEAIHYTHFRSFEDDFAQYDAFRTTSSNIDTNTTIPLYELVSKGSSKTTDKALTTLDLTDKIVMLYLESYAKTPDICTETNCDNLGEQHVQKLKVLLVEEKDINYLLANDNIYRKYDTLNVYMKLPPIKMPRVLLNSGAKEIETPLKVDLSDLFDLTNIRKNLVISNNALSPLKNSFSSVKTPALDIAYNSLRASNTSIKNFTPVLNSNTKTTINTKTYSALVSSYAEKINTVVPQLQSALKTITDHFSQLLSLNISEDFEKSIKALENHLEQNNGDIQYLYDHLCDLVKIYNELRDLLLDIQSDCCPNIDAFPKHLILGRPNDTSRSIPYRHRFYPSTTEITGKLPLKKAHFLVRKMLLLLKAFNPETQLGADITPSTSISTENAACAIPFYYNPSEDLVFQWNFKLTQRFNEAFQLSYFKKYLSPINAIQEPLKYDLNNYDFLRIEGIHGMPYDEALKEVSKLKTDYGLNFDIKAINIDQQIEDIDMDAYACHFNYLDTDLKTWCQEQNCINKDITEFFSGFNMDDLGSHNYAFEQFDRDDLLDKEVLIDPDKIKKPTDLLFSNNQLSLLGKLNINADLLAARDKTDREPLITLLDKAQEKISTGASIEDMVSEYQSSFVVLGEKLEVLNSTEPKSYSKLSTKKNTAQPVLLKASKTVEPVSPVVLNTGVKAYTPFITETKVNATVTDNLKTKTSDLGFIMNTVLDKNFIGSATEIEKAIDLKRKELYPKIDPEQQNLLKVGFTIPNGILARLQIVSSYIPESLDQVNADTKEKYAAAMEDLCAYTKKSRAIINEIFYNPKAEYTHIGYETLYTFMLDRLEANCCAASSLEIILNEIQTKKEEILDELIFSNFARKHPGLEHKAGVPIGGTFVMVYTGAVSNELDKEIPRNTVVADFALPYLCCSDCAPIGFIIPDAATSSSLILDQNKVCIDTNAETEIKIGFTKSPADGILALLNKNIEGIRFSETELIITPYQLNAFDTPIQFTVNGQLTTANLTATKKAAARITTNPERVSGLPGSTLPPVQFSIENLNNFNTDLFSFNWTINGTSYSNERPTVNLPIPQSIDSTIHEIPVTLTLSNDLCDSTTIEYTLEVTIDTPEEIRVSIENAPFCANDENKYPFTITPDGSEIKPENEVKGLEGEGDTWYFIPAEAGPGNHTIAFAEVDPITIEVYDAPETISFEAELKDNVMVLQVNQDIQAEAFSWFNDEELLTSTTEPVLEIPQEDKEQHLKIQVVVKTLACGTLKSEHQEVVIPALETDSPDPDPTPTPDPTPEPDPETDTCTNEVLEKLNKNKEELVTALKQIDDQSVKGVGKKVVEIYDALISQPDFFKGDYDTGLKEKLILIFSELAEQLFRSKPEQRQPYFGLYLKLQELFYLSIYCRDEQFLDNDLIFSILNLIENQFDPQFDIAISILEGIKYKNWYELINEYSAHFKVDRYQIHFNRLLQWTS
ncbi:hypothetical protein LDL79_16660 [Leeuwenhoekiella palythoae]|uniref:hypothetical protein n=1 Tax=Leeuwenhoekiella palythoae TaxID=573501 RepID=UPI001CE0639C|nr:hypothetical protein [Leeuwenhoekiella palythoae]UBZ10416.1 hypothetical protein LDL79_16660 [Leeuwenhoekiella palythoae]